LRVDGRFVAPRDLVEVYEALPSQPWPGRFQAQENGDCILFSVPGSVAGEAAALEGRFRAVGIPVKVRVADGDPTGRGLRALRSDLLETTFASEER